MDQKTLVKHALQKPETALEPAVFPGLRFQPLTPLLAEGDDICLIQATAAPDALVPLHSHRDHEVFYILSGQLEGLRGDSWYLLGPGDVFDIPGNVRHAFRNASSQPVEFLAVMTTDLGRFLHRSSRARSGLMQGLAATKELERFFLEARERGYWIGNAEDNAAVGITLPSVG